MAYCPECEADLELDEDQLDEGTVISCPDCGTDFEIVSSHPL
jgi:alpha-aminoadipate carrier protein LysW